MTAILSGPRLALAGAEEAGEEEGAATGAEAAAAPTLRWAEERSEVEAACPRMKLSICPGSSWIPWHSQRRRRRGQAAAGLLVVVLVASGCCSRSSSTRARCTTRASSSSA